MVEGRTHRPVIQPEKCHRCDVCLRGCPADLIREYREEKTSLRGTVYRGKLQGNPDPLPDELQLPACQKACPIHQDARGYVTLIAQRKFEEALELIREVNPLPAVCGFICHHPCEEVCLRTDVDQPIAIRLLKRFLAEYEREKGSPPRRVQRERSEKILVVGSGPAGLAAANDLRLLGYQVTVAEALPVLGGMLAVGIPEFRLPRDILHTEIEGIRALGVEMRTGHRFRFNGDGRIFEKLGFRALFLSTGAHRSLRLNIPGERLPGVFPGVQFLRDLNLGRKIKMGKSIAVIGGGNVALDVARSAVRMGSTQVELYYRRSRREMPAIPEEVGEAIREGVKIHFLVAPTRIFGKGGRVQGMECIRMRLGEADETGRRKPVPVKGSHFRVKTDMVIAAIGQGMDRSLSKPVETYPDGTIRVHPETGATNLKGVFAGGDAVTGPGWAIDAIAAGKRGATSIHEYLSS